MSPSPAPPPAEGPQPGETLLGRYRVVRELGRGGMGAVLEIADLTSGLSYALKYIPPELAQNKAEMEEVRCNFRLVSGLTHPHVGTTRFLEADPQTGRAYLIMDLVRGGDLANWLHEKRMSLGGPKAPLPMDLILGLGEQIAAALDYAHSQHAGTDSTGQRHYGILHRDLKPANVMVLAEDEYRPGVPFLKLVDFGLAATVQAGLSSRSVAQAESNVSGTPVYMAPEQWEARTLTRGVDQWALGVMLYEFAAAQRPFQATTRDALAYQICHPNPPPPPSLTPAQWQALSKVFNVDRKQRYPSCVALVKALAQADQQTKDSISVHEVRMPDEAPVELAATVLTASRAPSRSKAAAVAMAAVLVAAACVAGYFRFFRAPAKTAPVQNAARPVYGDSVLPLGKGVTLELVLIPKGAFTMGSPDTESDRAANEGPQHEVTIGKAFYMGKYEVTQEQYETVMGSNPSNFKEPRNPVEKVSWEDAQEFCQRVSAKTGRSVRLPAEAEWEYACRAGTKTRFCSGDEDSRLHLVAWFSLNSEGKTQPVGQKRPNAWGLHDMHGNVWEWCQDWLGNPAAAPALDPQGPAQGTQRVNRGGSWHGQAASCRSAFRDGAEPGESHVNLGFRVVVAAPVAP